MWGGVHSLGGRYSFAYSLAEANRLLADQNDKLIDAAQGHYLMVNSGGPTVYIPSPSSYTKGMPDNYALFTIQDLTDRYSLTDGLPKGIRRRYNFRPTQEIPVIVLRSGKRVLETMKWGLIPSGAKDANAVFRYKTHLAKSETIFEKAAHATAIRTQRCLIPANGFYGFKQPPTGKKAYYLRHAHQAIMSFAGIYSTWTDQDGKEWSTCAVVTTTANSETAGFKSRLPVSIAPEDEARWLDVATSDMNSLYDMMRQAPDGSFHIAEVGIDAASKKLDTPQLIEPIAHA